MEEHSQLLIFVPEGRRESTDVPVDLQDRWVMRLLGLCCELFGGATSYGRGVGVWKDVQGGRTHWDRVTVIESRFGSALRQKKGWMKRLTRVLEKMRKELRQKEVACIIDGKWVVLEGKNMKRRRS